MKYCEKCGHQLLDEAIMCPKCKNMISKVSTKEEIKESTNKTNTAIIKLLLGIGIIVLLIIAVSTQI